MNKLLFLGFSLFFLAGCASDEKKGTTADAPSLPATLEPFADSMVRLNKYSLESIETSAGYYQRLVPADSLLADSAAVMFLQLISAAVDSTNQQIYKDDTDYFELVYNEGKNAPENQKQFQQNLARSHVKLQGDGEGGAYAAPDYEWIQRILEPKTSAAVDAYLSWISREEKDPALLDGGLAIEMQELIDRLITTEHLQKQKLPSDFTEEVKQKNRFYTGVLLFGSVNSPALEYNEVQIVEEFKKGYDYLLARYPLSATALLAKEWQEIVRTKNSKKIEEWQARYQPYD